MNRLGIFLPLIWLIACAPISIVNAQSPAAMAARIDELVNQAAIGPFANNCNDADFLRRIHLDLIGVIPSAEQVRAFLADATPNKRELEIERLVACAEFDRFMTFQLTVWLLERRTEKNIPLRNWERFVYESIEADKPLDQLMSELVYAEPAGTQHPANKFILTREAEPNAVTRDVGRLTLGMDLQCAQCHHHPLIDNYKQEDYYGLFAFLNRTSLYTQPSTKQIRLAEKPDGEASFRSVFTGVARDHTTPRLPKEQSLFEEPTLLGDDVYREKPGKDSSGIPQFSRRQALAKMLRGSRQFQLNLANRLWALMFGRGLVHPLDFHHRDNAPSHAALLDYLADQLVASGYKVRPMLVAIAMSRCYQRACEPPSAESINYSDIAARCQTIQAEVAALQTATEGLKQAAAQADTAYNELLAKHDAHALELAKAIKEASEAQDKFKKANDAFQKADAPYKKALAHSEALQAAVEKLSAAAALISDDKLLATTSTTLAAKASKLTATLPPLEKAARDTQATLEKAQIEWDAKRLSLTKSEEQRVPPEQLRTLEQQQVETVRRLSSHLFHIDMAERQVALCQSLSEHQTLSRSDPSKAAAVWQTIVDRWTISGQVAPLKALTPEQLTLSAMKASGTLDRHLQEASAQARAILAKAKAAEAKAAAAKLTSTTVEAKNAAADKAANKAADKSSDKAAEPTSSVTALEQLKLIDTIRSRLDQFATLYGGLPGEDFQATVNQALFFGNGNVVDEWLKAGQNNLTDALVKAEASEVAERMFLSVLSRLPCESEKREVEQSLMAEGANRGQVISHWLWALLSSSEFRFNH